MDVLDPEDHHSVTEEMEEEVLEVRLGQAEDVVVEEVVDQLQVVLQEELGEQVTILQQMEVVQVGEPVEMAHLISLLQLVLTEPVVELVVDMA